ncbi:ribosomal silencing factor RsfS [Pseudohongiella nitratireducens]|uniref:Ribosomal silencing factor RsfS n=1 Tax=Pseudohongiella nitratireducens TaxID=1768907 RepID=A0A916QKZ3_9GAMM|nr:ribosome silencing factor [Pseudohongiella nitratireducens]MDF1624057.1 ribosome silencing factor [Pseudohongiella nitratireducens]GFZ81264.1 ribosomal silencing factor RsfS [Pseudohongiella nitratireducens]
METKQTLEIVKTAIEDMKGQQIEDYDVSSLTPLVEHMVIATGNSTTHIKALADEVAVKMKDAGGQVRGVEGHGQQADWVLVDLGDVVVHLMSGATRALYRLEDLWNFKALDADPEAADEAVDGEN